MTGRWALGARVLLAIAVAGTIWTSLLPPDDLPGGFGLYDKLVHGVGYAALTALALASGLRWPAALASVIGLGVGLEIVQGLLGYRSFEWMDVVADSVGAAVAVLLLHRPLAQWRRRVAEREQEAKRAARRERRQQAVQAPERPMNPAKAAARSGPPRWQQVMERQGTKCWLCGTRVYPDDREGSGKQATFGATYPEVDLVVPLEQGGSYAWDNVRLAHRACRRGRTARPDDTTFTTPSRTYG
jgi:5-methylcytosine-specific restriction endonuclease McrA